MRRALLLALAALGCACTGPTAEPFEFAEPFELIVSEDFTPEEHAVIEERAHEWLSTGASIGRVRVEFMGPEEDGHTVGFFEGGLLQIHPEARGAMFSPVVLHELGHAAGAAHHENAGCMHPFVTEALDCITPEDLATAGLEGPGTCGGAGE